MFVIQSLKEIVFCSLVQLLGCPNAICIYLKIPFILLWGVVVVLAAAAVLVVAEIMNLISCLNQW